MIRWGKHSYAATQPIVHSFGSVADFVARHDPRG